MPPERPARSPQLLIRLHRAMIEAGLAEAGLPAAALPGSELPRPRSQDHAVTSREGLRGPGIKGASA